MIIKRTSDPATEPITLSEARAHLRVDISDDDTLITSRITAAREYFEETTRRALITQTWQLSLASWPAVDYIELPYPPPQSVTSIIYKDSAGTPTTWTAAEYLVDTAGEPGRVVLAYGKSWPDTVTLYPTSLIQITYVAGYGAAAAVPQRMKEAILLLVGHWYENREATQTGTVTREIPLGLDSLIWLNRAY